MKKMITLFIAAMFCASLCGCSLLNLGFDLGNSSMHNEAMEQGTDTTENAKAFYNKVLESSALLDLVATDVCAAWKDASFDYNLSTKDVNDAIEKAKNAHSDNIMKINELDKEIRDLFDKAKEEMKNLSAEFALKQVMTAYSEYKDSILKANEALNTSGYVGVSVSKESLDRALRDLFVEL